jgi:tetratricopeptide (TPR) repeat protein
MLYDELDFGPYGSAERKARQAYEHYEEGKLLQALFELDEAIQINPSNGSWHFNKALTLDALGRFDDAIVEFQAALQLNPDDLEILNSLAVDYTRTGHYDKAIEIFEQIQELDPDFEPSYCNRIITYTEMNQHEMAEQMFYLAQQINPDCPLCYYNIGNSLFIQGLYDRAIYCWTKTAELEPTHPEINYRIAQACWAAGKNEQAQKHFLEELRLNPGGLDVILDFGLFLLETGDQEAAKEKFNRLLEFEADFAPAWFYLAEIAFEEEQYPQAQKLYQQALVSDGSLPGPRYRLAQCEILTGSHRKAHELLTAELALDIGDADVLVSLGSMFIALDDLDAAAGCFLRAINLDAANANASYYLGLVSSLRGRLEQADKFLNQTLEICPEHILALKDSAIVQLAMGRTDSAAEQIKKAADLAKLLPGPGCKMSQLSAVKRKIILARTAGRITDFLTKLKPRLLR